MKHTEYFFHVNRYQDVAATGYVTHCYYFHTPNSCPLLARVLSKSQQPPPKKAAPVQEPEPDVEKESVGVDADGWIWATQSQKNMSEEEVVKWLDKCEFVGLMLITVFERKKKFQVTVYSGFVPKPTSRGR